MTCAINKNLFDDGLNYWSHNNQFIIYSAVWGGFGIDPRSSPWGPRWRCCRAPFLCSDWRSWTTVCRSCPSPPQIGNILRRFTALTAGLSLSLAGHRRSFRFWVIPVHFSQSILRWGRRVWLLRTCCTRWLWCRRCLRDWNWVCFFWWRRRIRVRRACRRGAHWCRLQNYRRFYFWLSRWRIGWLLARRSLLFLWRRCIGAHYWPTRSNSRNRETLVLSPTGKMCSDCIFSPLRWSLTQETQIFRCCYWAISPLNIINSHIWIVLSNKINHCLEFKFSVRREP